MIARHDSHLGRLGNRNERQYWRLWAEETQFDRLTRNNFTPGTPFAVERRASAGVNVRIVPISTTHVSQRNGTPVFSYEAKDLGDFFMGPEVRYRIHVGMIEVLPHLRFHHVAQPQPEVWTIDGELLTTPRWTGTIKTASPLNLRQSAELIKVSLTEENLVYATELIGYVRPSRIRISGSEMLTGLTGQFLRAAGYAETDVPGEFAR